MSVIAPSPHLLGIGIDEDTAIVVTDHREFTVRGTGAVFVVDCTHRGHRRRRTPAPVRRCWCPAPPCTPCPRARPSTSPRRRLTGFVEQHPDLLVSVAAAKA